MTATFTGVQLVIAPSARYMWLSLTGAKAAGMAVLAKMACAAEPSDRTTASPREEIGGNDVHRDFCVFQIAVRQMHVHETVEALGAEQKIALAREPEENEWRDRKHISPAQISPNFHELFDTFNRGYPSVVRGVYGADTRAHHHVGGHAVRHERLQHADLDRPEAASARKNERCLQPASTTPFRERFDHPSGPQTGVVFSFSLPRAWKIIND